MTCSPACWAWGGAGLAAPPLPLDFRRCRHHPWRRRRQPAAPPQDCHRSRCCAQPDLSDLWGGGNSSSRHGPAKSADEILKLFDQPAGSNIGSTSRPFDQGPRCSSGGSDFGGNGGEAFGGFTGGSDFGDFTSSSVAAAVAPILAGGGSQFQQQAGPAAAAAAAVPLGGGQYQAAQQAAQFQAQQLQLMNGAYQLQQMNGPLQQQVAAAAAAAAAVRDPFAM